MAFKTKVSPLVLGALFVSVIALALSSYAFYDVSKQDNLEVAEEEPLQTAEEAQEETLDESLRLYDELFETSDNDEDKAFILIGRAATVANEGDFAQAIDLVEQAIAYDVLSELDYLNAQLVLAEYKAQNGNFDEAVTILEGLPDYSDIPGTESLKEDIPKRIAAYKTGKLPDPQTVNQCEVEPGSGDFEPC